MRASCSPRTARIASSACGPTCTHGPFASYEEYRRWLAERATSTDPLFLAFVEPPSGRAVGVGAFLRIDPAAGSIEVGHIAFSPLLQRSPAATEAMYLMMRHAFELGYRRYEWKCDALNAPSRRAAERLGFTFEGVFRQATVVQGPQPRHGLVLDRRPRVAGGPRRLRTLARSRQLRRGRTPAAAAG